MNFSESFVPSPPCIFGHPLHFLIRRLRSLEFSSWTASRTRAAERARSLERAFPLFFHFDPASLNYYYGEDNEALSHTQLSVRVKRIVSGPYPSVVQVSSVFISVLTGWFEVRSTCTVALGPTVMTLLIILW
jgi:hypothetical protein